MAQDSTRSGNLSATFWALLFIVCLGLVAAQLATAVRGQVERESGQLIESTFTRAAGS